MCIDKFFKLEILPVIKILFHLADILFRIGFSHLSLYHIRDIVCAVRCDKRYYYDCGKYCDYYYPDCEIRCLSRICNDLFLGFVELIFVMLHIFDMFGCKFIWLPAMRTELLFKRYFSATVFTFHFYFT